MIKNFVKISPYLLSYSIPIMTVIGISAGGYLSFLTPFIVFIILPILECFIGSGIKNLSKEEESSINQKFFFSLILFGHLIGVYYGLYIYLYKISSNDLLLIEIIGMTLSMGTLAGAVGITVAHELFHRSNIFERWIGKLLLLVNCYMHYYIEHVWGHHKNVGTFDDPATARFGESIYKFLPRTIINTYISAWKIESKILQSNGDKFFSIKNEMILFQLLTITFIIFIFLMFGLITTILFLFVGLIGVTQLEIVNYIEHYGLTRHINKEGNYEKIAMEHSWSSNNYISRWFLFELNRHSDHHLNASRKYQILRHIDKSPQHPAGYPAMMLLALVPFWWRGVMDKKVLEFSKN
ncbi:MAG: alkane 1-monooxygenase [Bacteroidetes bacterium]|nr:alkane 1-monooxygenase [Bacteroidota bacterium]